MRNDLLKQEVLIKENNHYIFSQDYTFNSPSTASGVVQGSNSSGRVDWKDKSNKPLKQLQEETTD